MDSYWILKRYFVAVLTLLCLVSFASSDLAGRYTSQRLQRLKNEVKDMFYHAYDGYMKYAYPYDELQPISCRGVDTWGSYSLTLIDAMDTLLVMGNYSEFARVAEIVSQREHFDENINVSVFETNIRIVGGLLSAHILSRKAGIPLDPGWPCNGSLLRLAEDAAQRLLPAFNSNTGMPYGTVNLRHGVPEGETPVTCTAGVGTIIVEFGTLSRLTGNPIYEKTALKALDVLWEHRSQLDLFGNHINVETGVWVATDAGIGASVDSYYEYLVKGASLFQNPTLMSMFNRAYKAVQNHVQRDDWHFWVTMNKGAVTLPVFQSLEAFWPGLLAMVGDVNSAMRTIHNYYQVLKQFGFMPEMYDVPQADVRSKRGGYPLRPEFVESLVYLYKATQDPLLLEMGEAVMRSIQHSARTPCGYATIKDVKDHKIEDRMESFFLAETTKYLYLLFDTENFIHNTGSSGVLYSGGKSECVLDAGGYIFNTEAHPVDPGILDCCSTQEQNHLNDLVEHSVSSYSHLTQRQEVQQPEVVSGDSGDYSLLSCKAATFLQRVCIMGEVCY